MGTPGTKEAARALSTALRVLEYLGVPVAVQKTEGQSHCITFLRILIDMNAFELRLPAEKCQRLQSLLQSWSTKKSCTRRELESPWTPISRSFNCTPRTHFSLPALQPATPRQGTKPLHPPQCWSQGRPDMVEMLPPELEWVIILPTPYPSVSCVLGCLC